MFRLDTIEGNCFAFHSHRGWARVGYQLSPVSHVCESNHSVDFLFCGIFVRFVFILVPNNWKRRLATRREVPQVSNFGQDPYVQVAAWKNEKNLILIGSSVTGWPRWFWVQAPSLGVKGRSCTTVVTSSSQHPSLCNDP